MPWRDRRRRRKQAEEWRENQRRMLEERLRERDVDEPSDDAAVDDVPDFGDLPEFGQLAEVLGAVGDVDRSADPDEADDDAAVVGATAQVSWDSSPSVDVDERVDGGVGDETDATDRLAPVVGEPEPGPAPAATRDDPFDVDVPASPDDAETADEADSPEAGPIGVEADDEEPSFARVTTPDDDGVEEDDGPHESWAPTSPLPASDSVASADSDDSPEGDPWLRDAPVNAGSDDSDDSDDGVDDRRSAVAVAEEPAAASAEEPADTPDPWARPAPHPSTVAPPDADATPAAASSWSDEEDGRAAGGDGPAVAPGAVTAPAGSTGTADATPVDDPWAVDERASEQEPVEDESAHDAWATEEPAAEEPAADPWARQEPVGEESAVEAEPAVDPWVREEPVGEEPAVEDEAAAEEPGADPWAREEPVGEEPAFEDEAAAEEPGADPWAREELVGEEPAADEAADVEPRADRWALDEPVADEPVAEEPAGAEPAAEVLAAAEPGDGAPADEQPAADPWARGDSAGAPPAGEPPVTPAPLVGGDEGGIAADEPPVEEPDVTPAAAMTPVEPQERPEVPVQLGAIDDEEHARALRRVVSRALAEDLGDRGDVTSMSTVPVGMRGRAVLVAREPGVVAGLDVVNEVIRQVDGRIHVRVFVEDGQHVEPGDLVARLSGPLRTLLTAERTVLNLVCRLSGIATHTAAFVAAVEGHDCVVRDTRKTTPGLRLLEKRAVRAGGGANHRIGLHDALLVKDNHVAAAGGVAAAARAALDGAPEGAHVQVEVTSVEGALEAIGEGVVDLLLDNFEPDELRRAVEVIAGRAAVEASGGITLETASSYAAAGADRLAVGALTHSAPALDLALDVEEVLDHTIGETRPRQSVVSAFAPPRDDGGTDRAVGDDGPAGTDVDPSPSGPLEGWDPADAGGDAHGDAESFDATRRILAEADDEEIVVDRAPYDETGDEAAPDDAASGDDPGGDAGEGDGGFDSLEFLRRWD